MSQDTEIKPLLLQGGRERKGTAQLAYIPLTSAYQFKPPLRRFVVSVLIPIDHIAHRELPEDTGRIKA